VRLWQRLTGRSIRSPSWAVRISTHAKLKPLFISPSVLQYCSPSCEMGLLGKSPAHDRRSGIGAPLMDFDSVVKSRRRGPSFALFRGGWAGRKVEETTKNVPLLSPKSEIHSKAKDPCARSSNSENPLLASASQSVICYFPCGQSNLPESISHQSPSIELNLCLLGVQP
jgi:hypothetical protein